MEPIAPSWNALRRMLFMSKNCHIDGMDIGTPSLAYLHRRVHAHDQVALDLSLVPYIAYDSIAAMLDDYLQLHSRPTEAVENKEQVR